MREDNIYREIEKARGYEEGEVIAVKIWTKEDIADVLERQFDIENITEDLINDIADNKGIGHLEDCYEEEWETIRLCCEEVVYQRRLKNKD